MWSLALGYARLGCGVVLCGRNRERLESVRDECLSLGTPAEHTHICIADMETDGVSCIVDALSKILMGEGEEERTYRLRHLVLNAGISAHLSACDTDIETLDRVMAVNCTANCRLSSHLLPLMRLHNTHLTVVSSMQGLIPVPARAAYCASKHAVIGWFTSLACEEPEVSVTIACPSWIDTPLRSNSIGSVTDKTDKKAISADCAASTIIRGAEDRKTFVFLKKQHALYPSVFHACPRWFYRKVNSHYKRDAKH
ncbi:short-chain dehydrogenase/reductase SDR [Kipferlia bialata]|uniref:Short-chain dehydrogenase/reductase SDR n=1 Tax=Kipferlia bialata TaxID=797122 RepID=A0A9K3GHN0_9EUKA|nr:short-chain dehydrogenase/reductase SDR [Kipferlia bialata]|eukprot:g5801.t1